MDRTLETGAGVEISVYGTISWTGGHGLYDKAS